MNEMSFLQSLHVSTPRNYLERATAEKPRCCEVAKRFGYDYWDGDRKYGYGGYRYDGRWRPVAEAMIERYGLKSHDSILDIGCGKGFLLYEFTQCISTPDIYGIDISPYAIAEAKDHILKRGYANHWFITAPATKIPFQDHAFDFVYSINTFHNLGADDLKKAVQEMMRVAKPGTPKYICVESYRNEQEKCNMLNWQLTCESFHRPEDWKFLLSEWGYDGDIEFIFFE